MRKICVFTGTRAEYGILSPLIRAIHQRTDLELQLVATCMHLSPEFGLTVREIEADGIPVAAKVEMLLSSDTPVGTAKSMGLGMIGFADALDRLRPDLILILGDRFEMLAAAQTALLFNIPVAHLHGGEITEGAYDDAIRHAITKLSHLHFTSTEEYRQNVIALCEDPARVFNVGALSIDGLDSFPLMSREELAGSIDFPLDCPFLSVTFHPVTTQPGEAARQTEELISAMTELLPRYKMLITLPNADAEGREIASMLTAFAAANPERVRAFRSLGRRRYFSSLAYAEAAVGNSSSGLLEAPSLGTPAVNIGDRQKGRAQAPSTVNCAPERHAIVKAVEAATKPENRRLATPANNPYHSEGTLDAILSVVAEYPLEGLIPKHFCRGER